MTNQTERMEALVKLILAVLCFFGLGIIIDYEYAFPAQVVAWITGAGLVFYGVMRYGKIKRKKFEQGPAAGSKEERTTLKALLTAAAGIGLIAFYYISPTGLTFVYTASILVLLVSAAAQMRKVIVKASVPASKTKSDTIVTIVIAIALFLFDAFVSGFIYVAMVLLLVVIPIILVKAVKVRKDRVLLKQALINAGIYALTAVAIIVMFNVNNTIAIKRTEMIADACERYKANFGEYPSELTMLVPEFMKEIPSAKLDFLFPSRFHYISLKDAHTIWYVKVPPSGRPTYSLERKTWGYID